MSRKRITSKYQPESEQQQEGSTKDKAKKPVRRPANVAGNKRQRKTFYTRGSH